MEVALPRDYPRGMTICGSSPIDVSKMTDVCIPTEQHEKWFTP